MRGLDPPPPRGATNLAAAIRPILDRRLRHEADAPVAVALSGGGDSLALTLLAKAWADTAGRRLLILTVDHRLQRDSGAWTAACAATARRLGADFQGLSWDGPKPATGLAAAARAARHRLLAEAARKAGAHVVLMGHTASDLHEAEAMRAAGSNVSDPLEWAPSPSWPEGRGLFLLRPLLRITRPEIRNWLMAHGETWIDDPANADPASARARARLATDGASADELATAEPLTLAEACTFDVGGGLTFPRQALRDATAEAGRAFLAMAAVCVGGGDRRPGRESLERLDRAARETNPITASLAGARIEAGGGEVRLLREAGEARRGGLTSLYLTPGQPVVWDGRFEFVADRPGLHVQRLEGASRKLDAATQHALKPLPAKARLALPVVVSDGGIACPVLQELDGVTVRCLVPDRLLAASGLIEREPA